MKLEFKVFERDQRRQRANTAIFYNVGGTLLPFTIVCIILSLFFRFENIISVVDRGDFCIYSVGLFSTAIFLFNHNRGTLDSRFDYWLHQSIFYLIIFAAVLYGGVYTKELVLKEQAFNINLVRYGSILLFIISIIATYRGLLIEYRKEAPKVNVEEERREEVNKIMKEL
jgi:hypothetical protein